jgi:nitrite reductase/ring-hydroxylating ferredoxin subunit
MKLPPPEEAIAHYRRRVNASETRVWENVLDWEHLPWLHRHAFTDLELLAASRTGWRVNVGAGSGGPKLELELEAHRGAGTYVARTVAGPGAGTEIWTRVLPAGERVTEIDVAFHVPHVPETARAPVGRGFVQLYTRLWDEDEAMMRRRQDVLDAGFVRARPEPGPAIALGPADALRSRVPFETEAGGVPVRIALRGEALVAYASVCPHLGGPLVEDVDDGCVRCPWHGYRFDPVSGSGIGDHGLRLPFAQRIEVDPETGEAHLSRPPVLSSP